MTDIYHSIIGLPESGKTTFLAALWHIIDAGEINTELKLDKLVGDHTYLNRIVEAWRKCLKVPRTTSGQDETDLSIHMHHAKSGQRIVLGFPDLSGESFNLQFTTRQCPAEYVENYEKEGGILLFVNANRAQDGIDIVDLNPILEEDTGTAEATDTTINAHKPWSPLFVPQQVRLVDLLQFLQRHPFSRRKRRLAIVISAWDVVTQSEPELEPATWLKRELPFLAQYLRANPSSFEFRVYGISAQGGDIPKGIDKVTDEERESRDKLLQTIPSERIDCIGSDSSPHDLTAPLCWLGKLK